MNSERFRFFSSVLHESDLLVGLSHFAWTPAMESACREEQERLYSLLSAHIAAYPQFASSLVPLETPASKDLTSKDMAPELQCMYEYARVTGTGPMSSVAGIFAEYVGRALGREVADRGAVTDAGATPDAGAVADRGAVTDAGAVADAEVMVENGGDLYVRNRKELVAVVHAGKVALSGKLGLVLPEGEWGVCTSSGTLGHSYSRGKADAVSVVCTSTPLADAWATALANEVEGKQDIEPLLDRVAEIPEIQACVVIAGGELGIRGSFETKLLT